MSETNYVATDFSVEVRAYICSGFYNLRHTVLLTKFIGEAQELYAKIEDSNFFDEYEALGFKGLNRAESAEITLWGDIYASTVIPKVILRKLITIDKTEGGKIK